MYEKGAFSRNLSRKACCRTCVGRPGLRGAAGGWQPGGAAGCPRSCWEAARSPPSHPLQPRVGTSNCWHFLRMMLTSVACRGAALCLTRRQSFLVPSQRSGRSCSEHGAASAAWPWGPRARPPAPQVAHVELQVDLLRHLLPVSAEQGNGLLQGFEHAVGRRLPLLDPHQVPHHLHQPVVVALLQRFAQAGVRLLDEILQLLEAGGKALVLAGCPCRGSRPPPCSAGHSPQGLAPAGVPGRFARAPHPVPRGPALPWHTAAPSPQPRRAPVTGSAPSPVGARGLLPGGDVAGEVLPEHLAPAPDGAQQRLLEGAAVALQPPPKHLRVGKPQHLLAQLLARINLGTRAGHSPWPAPPGHPAPPPRAPSTSLAPSTTSLGTRCSLGHQDLPRTSC